MKNEKIYQLLVEKMREMSVVPPQEVGLFTGVYKKIVPYLKVNPWKSAFLISFLSTFLAYIVFGKALVTLASILQFGF